MFGNFVLNDKFAENGICIPCRIRTTSSPEARDSRSPSVLRCMITTSKTIAVPGHTSYCGEDMYTLGP